MSHKIISCLLIAFLINIPETNSLSVGFDKKFAGQNSTILAAEVVDKTIKATDIILFTYEELKIADEKNITCLISLTSMTFKA